jgi:hypothetical protein
MTERPGRDRDGEPFQDNFTEDRGPRNPTIEEAQHDLNLEGDQVSGGDGGALDSSRVWRPDEAHEQHERTDAENP